MRFRGLLRLLAAAIALASSLTGDSGFVTLADGKTAAGWRTLSGPHFPVAAWRIEDGCLRTIGRGLRADVATEFRFRNFEWEFEWKVGEGVNSGVKYLVWNSPIGTWPGTSSKAYLCPFALYRKEASGAGTEQLVTGSANLIVPND